MKLMSPEKLFKRYVKEEYDVIISYLEGPSARIAIGGKDLYTNTKFVSWIHVEQHSMKNAASSFRNEQEAKECYGKFDEIVCVSQTVADDFEAIFHSNKNLNVLYNTVQSDQIREQSVEVVKFPCLHTDEIKIIGIGSLKESKGFDRLIRIHEKLRKDGLNVHTYILGKGPLLSELEKQTRTLRINDTVTFLGYQTNPYAYLARCDLFVCSSFAEGFSTAATESLIVGTPVCTVKVSGMEEMLGNNEFGIITENNEDALYQGIKKMLEDPEVLNYYKQQAIRRGQDFSTEKTVQSVEDFLFNLVK